MKYLAMCLVFLVGGCSSLHAMVVDEGEILKQKEITHRIAVKGNIAIAKLSLKEGFPVNLHEQDLESDAQGGYMMGGVYGAPGMMGAYGMSPTAQAAEAMSLTGNARGNPPTVAAPQTQGQPAEQGASAQCPNDRAPKTQAEKVACLEADQVRTLKALAKRGINP